MGRIDYLAMKTDEDTVALLNSDFNELKIAAKKLINHATKLGGVAFGTSFLEWVASFAAMSVFPLPIFFLTSTYQIVKLINVLGFWACV